LLDLVPTEPPYVAVLDRTEWHFGQTAVNALMVGIAEGGIAYPVTWGVLVHGGGSPSKREFFSANPRVWISCAERSPVKIASLKMVATGRDLALELQALNCGPDWKLR
jgi:hypothetical protein